MASLFKKTQDVILLIDIYKSVVSYFVFSVSEGKIIWKRHKNINLLRVGEPKFNLWSEALQNSISELRQELTEYTQKNNFALKHIYILPHGPLSQVKTHEIFVKLNNNEQLTDNLLSNIMREHYLDKNSFANLINNTKDGKRYFLAKKAISQIAPNYYQISNWKNKRASKLSFLVTQCLVDEALHNSTEQILSEIFPDIDTTYINPGTIYSLTKQTPNTIFNIVDLGAEFTDVYQIYRGQIINSVHLSVGTNHIIRDLIPETGSFELAESAITAYLKGNCTGETCSHMKTLLDNYANQLTRTLKSSNFNKSVMHNTFTMINPSLDDELVKFQASLIAAQLNNKNTEAFDTAASYDAYITTIAKFASNSHGATHNTDFIITN